MQGISYFLKRVFQGDILFLLLLIFSMNPLSFSLHKRKGYACRKHKNYYAMQNFFADDLKLYTNITNTAKKPTRSTDRVFQRHWKKLWV